MSPLGGEVHSRGVASILVAILPVCFLFMLFCTIKSIVIYYDHLLLSTIVPIIIALLMIVI